MKISALDEQLSFWKSGVLQLNAPASSDALTELQQTIQQPLPVNYTAILQRFNGGRFHGETVYTATEAREQWERFFILSAPFYSGDPDWPNEQPPPRNLLPVGDDATGNLLCMDLSTTGPELVEWNREQGLLTTIHSDVVSWLVTRLKMLELQFDHQGRPRAMRAGHAHSLDADRIRVHADVEPNGALPTLELAHWLATNSTPEEALFAYRTAADAQPQTAMNHYMHALFSISQKRHSEARRALRRAVGQPMDSNPRKHSFRTGVLPAAHKLLALLYEQVEQTKKAELHHRQSDVAARRYGFGWYQENEDYQRALNILMVR